MNFKKAYREIMSSKTSKETYENMGNYFNFQRLEQESPRLLEVLYKHCLANKDYLLDHRSYKQAIELMSRAYDYMNEMYPEAEQWLDKEIDAEFAKLNKRIVTKEQKNQDFKSSKILDKARITTNIRTNEYNTRKLIKEIAKTQGIDLFAHHIDITRRAVSSLLVKHFDATADEIEHARLEPIADKNNNLGLMCWYFEILYSDYPLTHTKTITVALGTRELVLEELMATVCKPKDKAPKKFVVWADMQREAKENGFDL